jgi:hypothetical protein
LLCRWSTTKPGFSFSSIKKYRDKGLAIVALDFEEPEEKDKLTRERAFVKEYGVKYTYLIAGAPSEMWEKVP